MSKTTFLLYNEIIEYDACTDSNFCTLECAISYYATSYDYIGTSKIFYVNDVEIKTKYEHYFFRYRTREDNKKIIRRLKIKKISYDKQKM